MKQQSKYDPKGLTLGIVISLGAAGLAFLLGHFAVPFLLNTDLSCSTITEDDWKQSRLYKQFNSLESFIQSCKTTQNTLDWQINTLPSIIMPPVGFGIFFLNWIRFGWHLKKETKQ